MVVFPGSPSSSEDWVFLFLFFLGAQGTVVMFSLDCVFFLTSCIYLAIPTESRRRRRGVETLLSWGSGPGRGEKGEGGKCWGVGLGTLEVQ